MQIEITALKKSYGENAVLKDISLTIENGMYGLLGRNGAGKTTFMRILSTLLKPSAGKITFDHIPLEETKQIRPLIGYLPQEFSLYPDMSVSETMRYLAAISKIPVEIQRERIVIVSSHIVADIESVCTNVAVLDSGWLLYAGTIGQLAEKARGKVYELTIPKDKLETAKQDYYVLSSQGHLSDTKIRVLADSVPAVGCPAPCVPTAQDGYMELLRLLEAV
nr:ATP-binding cassette domain-containing protein [uncultured Schaedlerella sp.]